MIKAKPKIKDDEVDLVPAGTNARIHFEKNIRHELEDLIHDEDSLTQAFETWLDVTFSCKKWRPYKGATWRFKFTDSSKKFWFESTFG